MVNQDIRKDGTNNMQEPIVTILPPKLHPNGQEKRLKKNVTYYARVSTDYIEQEESFERQQDRYESLIKSNKNWNYIPGYADRLTGTNSENRPEFLRMINDCRAGLIDKILVKSVARFARNLIDTRMYVDELKDLGVSVYFENENIDSLTPNGEMQISILAMMAEQESRNISHNIRWSYQKRFKEGKVLINSNMYGYRKDIELDKYVVVEEEAKVVRRIFAEYQSGKSIREIINSLTLDGIKTRNGNKFRPGTIELMLSNEKYTGNALLGKTYKRDITSKKRVKNIGQGVMYYVENSHEAIISQELFEKVQFEKKRRAELRSSINTGKGKYSAKYPFSSLLICKNCGHKFRREARQDKNGNDISVWRCKGHMSKKDECQIKPVRESDIYKAYQNVMNHISGDLSETMEIVRKSIDEEIKNDCCENLETVSNELKAYRDKVIELFKKKNNKDLSEDMYNDEIQKITNSILELEKKEKELKEKELIQNNKLERYNEIKRYLDNNKIDDQQLMRKLINEIVVIGTKEFEFHFECGIVEIELLKN